MGLHQREGTQSGPEGARTLSTEANLWSWLRDVVLPLGQYSRIESGDTAPGIPDVHYQIDEHSHGWIELKHCRRSTDHFPFTKKRGIRRSQLKWIKEAVRRGAVVWIVAQVGKKVYVIPGEKVHEINGCKESHLGKIATVILDKSNNQQSAQKLERILINSSGE